MLEFKKWLEDISDVQKVYLGGRSRAVRNDTAISYDPQTNTAASHKYSDEIVPDNAIPWLIAMQQRGYGPKELSAKLWRQKKIKASPETISNKLNVARTDNTIEPTLRKKELGDIVQPTAKDDYINNHYFISPEAKELIVQWSQQGMPASFIHKKLKQQGMDISYRVMLDFMKNGGA